MSDYIGKVSITSATGTQEDMLIGSTLYGLCSSSASVAEKTVRLNGFSTVMNGITIQVRFTNGNNILNDVTLIVGDTTVPIAVTGNCVCNPNDIIAFTYEEIDEEHAYWRAHHSIKIETAHDIVTKIAGQEINIATKAYVDSKTSELNSYTQFLGIVRETPLSDGATMQTVIIDSEPIVASTGDIVIYQPTTTAVAQEYIFDGAKWNFFGDLSAQNLGALAYKNTVEARYTQANGLVTSEHTITATGQFQPAGTISVDNSTLEYIKFTSTTEVPSNTSNYWIYTPQGTVSVTYVYPSTSSDVIETITPYQIVTTAAIAEPTTANVADGLVLASVTNHNLDLNYLIVTTGTSVTASTIKAYTGLSTTQSTSCTFNGFTSYSAQVGITIPETFIFEGTTAAVAVTANVINNIELTTTAASATITYTP